MAAEDEVATGGTLIVASGVPSSCHLQNPPKSPGPQGALAGGAQEPLAPFVDPVHEPPGFERTLAPASGKSNVLPG